MRVPVLPIVLLFGVASSLAAQDEGGRYQPIAAWTTPYVEHLIRAGVLRDPDPLTRPLRRTALSRALREADTTSADGAVRAIVRLLGREFETTATDSVRWHVEASLGALAASDARRWAERPSADSVGLFAIGGLEGSLEMPHLTLVTHPVLDNRLKHDPDYTGIKTRAVGGRNAEAYVEYASRYADLFFGIVDRNWGPPQTQGLLLSPSPYGFDHLYARFGPRRLRVEVLFAMLDELGPWTDQSQQVTRGLTLHRLVAAPSDGLRFSLFEGLVYTGSPGIPRFVAPWYLNPMNSLEVAQYQDSPTGNTLMGFDVAARVRGTVRVAAQFYLDDLQVDRRSALDREPPSYGLTLVGTGGLRHGTVSWTALYTRVTNLSYRTPAREEQYTIRRVGIARDHSDYDQATLTATVLGAAPLLATAEFTVIRQGAGDMRDAYPDTTQYHTTPTFLSGVVERTVRVAAQASWTPRPDITVALDVGRHFVANAGHVAGASEGRWVWRLRGELRRRSAGRL